jgi:signal transduction histidine kinase
MADVLSGEQPHTDADPSLLLLELGRAVTSSLDLQEVLDKSLTAIRRLVDFGGGAIQLVEEDVLVPAATVPPMSEDAKRVRIPVGTGISGTIAATGKPIYIPDIWADPRVDPGRARGVSGGVRSYFGMPLILQGRSAGVVQIDSPEIDAFSTEARSRVMMFVPMIAAAVQNAQLFDRERQALQRLMETEQLQRDFLAVVSHELRTPLTSVSGFGLTLAEHARSIDSETVADIGQRIWRASRRLERVMSDLLDLSRIERGALQADVIPTDIEPILRESVREQSNKEHPVVLELGPEIPKAMVDGDRLHQILGNLLSNARKFSPAGTPIEVQVQKDGNEISIAVIDQGKGIPEGMLDRIFDRFFQGEPATTRSADGMGVGLYLVKQLCDRMGASIEVRSTVGSGTRFVARIPRAA